MTSAVVEGPGVRHAWVAARILPDAEVGEVIDFGPGHQPWGRWEVVEVTPLRVVLQPAQPLPNPEPNPGPEAEVDGWPPVPETLRTPQRLIDKWTEEGTMGGKPSKGTPKDGRLKENQPPKPKGKGKGKGK